MPSESPQPDRARLSRPVLLRAAVALAFGGATVFWGQPTTAGAAWVFAAYVWLLLAAEVWLVRSERPAPSRVSALAGLVAFALGALAAVVPLVAPTDGVLGGAGAAALVLVGASDVARGIIARRAPSSGVAPLARDLLIVGIVTAGAGVLLPFFAGLGPHALLGVAGGAAVIAGVLFVIAGLSLRHDAAASARVA
ncbi:hypothetical protein SPF06_12175 [Sinomonas sp. JGH33]|uniref:DUF308 domain-containing protein n=1 Tax=Sinomonas terricola TaxID=3110330 RepID=A0ABU5T8R2_9MICC|nr:hypothetical protein [Sinomonas sp. JGH33]MEA5455481.1 hypothetical protein [Sinomonas sp. JGH33]